MDPPRRGVSAYLAPKACGVSTRTPPLARGQRPAEKGGKPISRREEAENSSADWNDAFSRLGEGFCWKRRLAYTRWSQWRLAVRGVQVGGGMPREAAGVHHGIAEEAVRAMEGAPGLEKRLYIQRKVKDPLRCRPRRRQRPTVICWNHKPEKTAKRSKPAKNTTNYSAQGSK